MPPENRNKFQNTHTLKIPILLQSSHGEFEGFIFDYTTKGFSFFCSKEFVNGDKVKITQVKGKAVSPFHGIIVSFQASPTKGTVISPNFPVFKVGLAFAPETEEEKKLLEELLKEIAK